MHRKYCVLVIASRAKQVSKSGLYLPKSNRGEYTAARDVWVLSAANDCKYKYRFGMHGLVADGFEFEDVPDELADEYVTTFSAYSHFSDLFDYVIECEGTVGLKFVHEDSILGEVIGKGYQEDVKF